MSNTHIVENVRFYSDVLHEGNATKWQLEICMRGTKSRKYDVQDYTVSNEYCWMNFIVTEDEKQVLAKQEIV